MTLKSAHETFCNFFFLLSVSFFRFALLALFVYHLKCNILSLGLLESLYAFILSADQTTVHLHLNQDPHLQVEKRSILWSEPQSYGAFTLNTAVKVPLQNSDATKRVDDSL